MARLAIRQHLDHGNCPTTHANSLAGRPVFARALELMDCRVLGEVAHVLESSMFRCPFALHGVSLQATVRIGKWTQLPCRKNFTSSHQLPTNCSSQWRSEQRTNQLYKLQLQSWRIKLYYLFRSVWRTWLQGRHDCCPAPLAKRY